MSNSLHRRLDAIEGRIKALSTNSDTDILRAFFQAADSEEGFDWIKAKWPNHPMVQFLMADDPDEMDDRDE